MYLIKVKNCGERFSINAAKFNLYEQTERNGRVLWIHFQSIRKGIDVKNVILSIKGNFEYTREF
jgi:hypothetical protein